MLRDKGWIEDPVGKAKSVVLTQDRGGIEGTLEGASAMCPCM